MSKTVVYTYDHEACTFVAVAPNRRGLWLKAGAVVALALVLAAVGVGVLSQVVASPVEVAQRREIDALRGQLKRGQHAPRHRSRRSSRTSPRPTARSTGPSSTPTRSRTRASAMGAGGARDERFGRFSTPTRELLTETTDDLRPPRAPDRAPAPLLRRAAHGRGPPRRRPAPAARHPARPRRPHDVGLRHALPPRPARRAPARRRGLRRRARARPSTRPATATVSFVGTRGGYGNVVEVDHPLAGRMTRFAHLTAAAPGLRQGTAVRRGQIVAYSGHSGLSTAPAPALRGPPAGRGARRRPTPSRRSCPA